MSRDLFKNQIPVVNLLLPVIYERGRFGLVGIKKEGRLILPGGHIESGKDWQEICIEVARFGARVRMNSEAKFWPIDCQSSNRKAVLILFAQGPSIKIKDLLKWKDQNSERVLLKEPAEMAFLYHTKMVARFFGVHVEVAP